MEVDNQTDLTEPTEGNGFSTGEKVIFGKFYPWQLQAWRQLVGKNAVLSAPTGSGKTLVAYFWAGLIDEKGCRCRLPAGEKIIFTAPIKALSNERYLDLMNLGFEVGIETGDFKKNIEAPIICCTQEIYALKYAGRDNMKLIIDEFHYIFSESERSRAYIDGIRKTYPAVPILVMSATFGQPESVRRYLQSIVQLPFELYQTDQRITKLNYMNNGEVPRQIHDALVFVFSQRGVLQVADMIAEERLDFDTSRKARLKDLAWILQVERIPRDMYKGVGVYYGSLLPKEKLLVERAYRERIIDVVVGTDALALGVNLPAETVVFAQLVKFHDRLPLSKMAFLQMSGRAGRKGLFDEGFVTWLKDSPAESRGVETGRIFKYLCSAPVENARVQLHPEIGAILKKRSTIDNEAEIVSQGSLPPTSYKCAVEEIRASLQEINDAINAIATGNQQQFRSILADIWYGEMETEQNLEMARLFMSGIHKDGVTDYVHPDAISAAALMEKYERNRLQAMLMVKRFNNSLPDEYKFTGMEQLEEEIVSLDSTVFGFEDRIQEMDATAVELPNLEHRLINRDKLPNRKFSFNHTAKRFIPKTRRNHNEWKQKRNGKEDHQRGKHRFK